MADSLITQILETCDKIKTPRDYRDVLTSLVEEVGELSTEIAIDGGHKKGRKPSQDGIIGESLDIIINAVDEINLAYKKQGYTAISIEMLLMARAKDKLEKWEHSEDLPSMR